MTFQVPNSDARGSLWNRWDPHIHTPRTLLNDQFGGANSWDAYLGKLEAITPEIRAIGITDYLSIEQYEAVARYKTAGRLPNVAFVFPNVEMRFGIETAQGAGVNVHLLFSPHDPNHVDEINRFLHRLEFRYPPESYRCCKADLIRLGRRHTPAVESDEAALVVGVNQFKVSFEQLQDEWGKSLWVRQNCLVAVAAGERDGTSGLRDEDDSFAALRKSIEAFAHIIFSANPSQIEFWLGRRAATVQDLETKWGGLKPCLHGSDAHDLQRLGAPDGQRYCWIKGDLNFETLRQASIEPEGRVHIGASPPRGSLPGHTIQALEVSNAPWMAPSSQPLNSGLVAVIGARGSGKTALADLLAVGGLADIGNLNPRSFVVRASEHLAPSRSELLWEHGEVTGKDLKYAGAEDLIDPARVQYLSQQFVEDLCSAEGLADSLVVEIERVVFNSHPVDEREGTTSFKELYALRSAPAIARRLRQEGAFEAASDALALERQLKQELPGIELQRTELVKQIAQDKKDRQALVGKGQEDRAKRHAELLDALAARRRILEAAQLRLRDLSNLKDDVADIRSRRMPMWLAALQAERANAALRPQDWDQFKLQFAGDVDTILIAQIGNATEECKRIAGTPTTLDAMESRADPNVPLIPGDAPLGEQPVGLLQGEAARLAKLIGTDAQNSRRFAALTEKMGKATKALERLDARITMAKSSDERIQDLLIRRREAYGGIFSAIIDLEAELARLYAPLAARLSGAAGPLGQLSFAVRRQVDNETWAAAGEKLLDLRRNGPFKGRGALLEAATNTLLGPWQRDGADDVATAMADFIKENEASLKAHKPEGAENREWIAAVSSWLHSTQHIEVSYGVQYDGVAVERLSPGTRGIVLLLLYLAIDEEDDRPLIIDQPEENLDPQSIFDELVSRFRIAKQRRQIVIVTHNANLVVNTDADQVIVASAGQHRPGQLPEIRYESGGLENPLIRKRVCEILEGGERAFRARARRLRLDIHEAAINQVADPSQR